MYSLIAAIFILVFEVLYLFHDFGYIQLPIISTIEETTGNRVGEVESRRNRLLRKSSESLLWSDLANKSTVFNSDMLMTLENSGGEIRFDDNAVLVLGENTLISLHREEKLDRDLSRIHLDVVRGKVRAVVKKAPRKKSKKRKRSVIKKFTSLFKKEDPPKAAMPDMKQDEKEPALSIVLPDKSEIKVDSEKQDIDLVIEKKEEEKKVSISVDKGAVALKTVNAEEITVEKNTRIEVDEKTR